MRRGRAGLLIRFLEIFGYRKDDAGKKELWKTRVHLLSNGARIAMESFVEQKMEEMKVRKLVEWDVEAVRGRLAEVVLEDD